MTARRSPDRIGTRAKRPRPAPGIVEVPVIKRSSASSMIADDAMFVAEGNIEAAEGQEPTLKVTSLKSLAEAEASEARSVSITLPATFESETDFEQLYNLLERERGRCGVYLTMAAGGTRVKLQADGLTVNGSRALQTELEARGCSVEWLR